MATFLYLSRNDKLSYIKPPSTANDSALWILEAKTSPKFSASMCCLWLWDITDHHGPFFCLDAFNFGATFP